MYLAKFLNMFYLCKWHLSGWPFLHVNSKQIYVFLQVITYGLTGHIEFNEYGIRENYLFKVHQLELKKPLREVNHLFDLQHLLVVNATDPLRWAFQDCFTFLCSSIGKAQPYFYCNEHTCKCNNLIETLLLLRMRILKKINYLVYHANIM